jgi:ankyrin repeat protein
MLQTFYTFLYHTDVETQPGGTALCAAAGSGHLDVCRLLLEHGARVDAAQPVRRQIIAGNLSSTDAESQDGDPALNTAARHGHVEVCRLLLEHGARVDAAQPVRRQSVAGNLSGT